ncbi:murein L,D-transpeptidase catalytic domain family protein [bacterium]|nr:murein L,D-transpeptidase catalytic domain family protein [bacterium]
MFIKSADSTDLPSAHLLQTALAGYEILAEGNSITRPGVITIIDFSLRSDEERLWILDLNQGKVLFHCLVSHGRNSGENMAENFSNIPGSNASSPGFYITGETYMGKNGLSLALDGLEKGINDKARARAIVLHGADYVSRDFILSHGRLGRSLGCPAVPVDLSDDIIKTIKDGSCLFIYAPQESYISNSHIISKISLKDKT